MKLRQCERCLEELRSWQGRHACPGCGRKVCVRCWNRTDKLCTTCDRVFDDGRDLGAKQRPKRATKKSRGG